MSWTPAKKTKVTQYKLQKEHPNSSNKTECFKFLLLLKGFITKALEYKAISKNKMYMLLHF